MFAPHAFLTMFYLFSSFACVRDLKNGIHEQRQENKENNLND